MLVKMETGASGGGGGSIAATTTTTGNIANSSTTTYTATQNCTIIAIMQTLFYSAGWVKVKKGSTSIIESTTNGDYVVVSYHLNSGESLTFDCNTNATNMMYYIVND